MKVRDIAAILERWAPPVIAWDRDNVGLHCGSPDGAVRGILVTLDLTAEVVREARRRGATLIVSHHPPIFTPLRAVRGDDPDAAPIIEAVRAGIAVYAAHTNLDFARGGTSFALAAILGLRDTMFLHSTYKLQRKIVTFVPAEKADGVARAMADAGAGVIGDYRECSFRIEGTGTFRGVGAARPAVGRRGVLERVPEVRIEMVVPEPAVAAVVRAMKGSHPYEEVAYDVYPTDATSPDYGMGAIGVLRRPVPLAAFLRRVRRTLAVRHLRYTGDLRAQIGRVAVCGGSGGELLEPAVTSGADAFLTADVRYHTYHRAAGRIALIDAGHYETEFPVVRELARRLSAEMRRRRVRVPVTVTRLSTNPMMSV